MPNHKVEEDSSPSSSRSLSPLSGIVPSTSETAAPLTGDSLSRESKFQPIYRSEVIGGLTQSYLSSGDFYHQCSPQGSLQGVNDVGQQVGFHPRSPSPPSPEELHLTGLCKHQHDTKASFPYWSMKRSLGSPHLSSHVYPIEGLDESSLSFTTESVLGGPKSPYIKTDIGSDRESSREPPVPHTAELNPPARAPRRRERSKAPGSPSRIDRPLSELTADHPDVAVVDIDGLVRRPTEERQREIGDAKDPNKIKRPMNAFMLYRKAYQNLAKRLCAHINHQVVSQVCGDGWRLEPDDVREQFTEWARIERANHQRAHPLYKFTPAKPKPKVNDRTAAAVAFYASTLTVPSNGRGDIDLYGRLGGVYSHDEVAVNDSEAEADEEDSDTAHDPDWLGSRSTSQIGTRNATRSKSKGTARNAVKIARRAYLRGRKQQALNEAAMSDTTSQSGHARLGPGYEFFSTPPMLPTADPGMYQPWIGSHQHAANQSTMAGPTSMPYDLTAATWGVPAYHTQGFSPAHQAGDMYSDGLQRERTPSPVSTMSLGVRMGDRLNANVGYLTPYSGLEGSIMASPLSVHGRIDPFLDARDTTPYPYFPDGSVWEQGPDNVGSLPLDGLDEGLLVEDPQLPFLRGTGDDWQVRDPELDWAFSNWT